jgi:hypothetical protein
MADLQLSDLHNPEAVIAILHNNGQFIKRDPKDQGFQETSGRYELWQKLEDGRLLCVRAWNKKSVVATY